MNMSEIARLLETIEAEQAAAHRALHEMAYGTARHDFISTRMERAQASAEALIEKIGPGEALPLIVMAMDNASSQGKVTQ